LVLAVIGRPIRAWWRKVRQKMTIWAAKSQIHRKRFAPDAFKPWCFAFRPSPA